MRSRATVTTHHPVGTDRVDYYVRWDGREVAMYINDRAQAERLAARLRLERRGWPRPTR